MRICWAFAAILAIIASLLVTGIASASAVSAETRIGAFDPADQIGVGIQTPLTLNLHQGCELAQYDVASGSLLAAKGGGKWTKEVIERKAPGADGATSRHIIEKLDGKTNSVTHQVTKDGKVIHQHQTHIGKHGTQRQFPDEWVEYPKVPGGRR